MTRAQWTVFSLLVAIGALEVIFSPTVHDYVTGVQKGLTTKEGLKQVLTGSGQVDLTVVLVWAISAAVLLSLADLAPSVALWVTVLILTGVVLYHGQTIGTWLQTYANDMRGGRQTVSSAAGAAGSFVGGSIAGGKK